MYGTIERIRERSRDRASKLRRLSSTDGLLSLGLTPVHDAHSPYRMAGLVDDRAGHFEKFRKSEEELKRIKNKKVVEFYKKQNCILDDFAEGTMCD